MIAIIDNYDSFTYNIVQMLRSESNDVLVFRNDEITAQELEAIDPDAILISPGPGNPSTAGISRQAVQEFSGRIPILGICLGHQTIADVFGARIIGATRIVHGKTSTVLSDQRGLFRGIPQQFEAMRYHSLVVDPQTLPSSLAVTARSDDGEIMGIRLVSQTGTTPVEGIQFHPESIMTPVGKHILHNFAQMVETFCRSKVSVKERVSCLTV